MKKGLKIGVVALAIAATVTTLISTGNVKAENEGTSSTGNLVQVVIGKYNSGQNTCTLGNYLYEFQASTADDEQTTGNILDCKFGNQAQQAVTLQLSGDLTSGSGNIISKTGVLLSNNSSTWTQVPNIGTATNHSNITFYEDGDNVRTLFSKDANVIGAASGTVEIKVMVPGGTPDGTYEGTLVLSYGG